MENCRRSYLKNKGTPNMQKMSQFNRVKPKFKILSKPLILIRLVCKTNSSYLLNKITVGGVIWTNGVPYRQ